jgi:hypothetical protein
VAARVGVVAGGLILLDKVIHNLFLSMQKGNGILASASAALRGYSLNEAGARIETQKTTAVEKLRQKEIAQTVAALNTEEYQTYKNITAMAARNKLGSKDAAIYALRFMSMKSYIGGLHGEAAELYNTTVATSIKNGATEEEAALNGLVALMLKGHTVGLTEEE